jgi:phospholipid/cholesterol/gamma-HCH transport system permease protein
LIPREYISYGARDAIILEFASTMLCLILAGKIGANITSELGTMRITQQIDALEMMGINSAGYLVLPKLIATLIFFPIFNMFSIIVGLFGGWLVAALTGLVNIEVYENGLHLYFVPYHLFYSGFKSVFFGLIITTVSAYLGYYVEGGSVEVGKASTNAIVTASILILMFNIIITNLMF